MNSQYKKIFFRKHIFVVFKEVYEPAEDTFLLASNLSVNESEMVLDIGTGCGILAILAAAKTSKVVATDISPPAVACAKSNAELNGVAAKIETRLGDLFSIIKSDEKFNLILFNAPYLPVEQGEGKSWIERTWAGGRTGRSVIDRFISKAPKYLTENGRILFVQSSLSNIEKTVKQFLKQKLYVAIIDEKKFSFEKIVLIEARKE